MNLPARFIGVLTSPRDTFASIAAHPKVLGMLVLTIAISAFAAALPMMTEGGRQAAVDQQVSFMEGFGIEVSDEAYTQIQKGASRLPYTTAAGVIFSTPIVILIITGILFLIFNVFMGGDARFKQLLAVFVHSGVVSSIGGLFAGIINYFRQAAGSATSIGALLPMIDEKSFLGRLLGMADVFAIWGVIVLAIGLAVLYRRKTQPIAITFFGIYAVIILAIAAFTSK